MIGLDFCEGWPRWSLANAEYIGFELVVFVEHGDDEEPWYALEEELSLRTPGYSRLKHMPANLRSQPDKYRDPLTWCEAQEAKTCN